MFDVGWVGGGRCGCGYICGHVGTGCLCTCVWRREVKVMFFLDHSSPFLFLRQGLSLKPKFITSARLPVSFRTHLLHLSSAFRPAKAELTGTCLAHHMNSGDLNSDPHSCTVGTLPKEPFLQLSGQGLLTCGKSIQNDNGGMLFTLSV